MTTQGCSMKLKYFSLLFLLLTISACSIKQTVDSSEISKQTELCIIENHDVREGFLQTLQSSLRKRDINHRVISNRSIPNECEWIMRYVGRWNWDLALYMSYAEIQVFHNGKLDGEAIYDSTRGGANMAKFIDAEPKIEELVNELLKFNTSSLFYLSLS
ncbi:Sbal_3080 family lipoprotein [uncultured Methylophaga sp.]|uniref:Sbal_3080 family lipoprotein n=1 Tax=uncultured Methylophaga sp. TaxID=285271 RepID=UPI00262ABB1C|nr:Sbal_3080 family lipoprotein [uncultured Methylophaga sp.]